MSDMTISDVQAHKKTRFNPETSKIEDYYQVEITAWCPTKASAEHIAAELQHLKEDFKNDR